MTVSTVQPTIVDTSEMEWISGPDLLAAMDPAFVANLGPKDEVADAFEHYLVKPLLREEGGRRMDLAQFTHGYRDVTACYHESAEEGFVIDGSFNLAYEGTFTPEHYFWRPPGWVHGTLTTDGATAIFSFEAASDVERSGPVTRTVAEYSQAGENVLLEEGDPRRIGPRGYIPNVAGGLAARIPGDVWISDKATAKAWDAERFVARTLSRNVFNGGGTYLLDLSAGFRQPDAVTLRSTYHFFIVSGDVTIGDTSHKAGTWVYVPGGVSLGAISSQGGATLYTKTDTAFELA